MLLSACRSCTAQLMIPALLCPSVPDITYITYITIITFSSYCLLWWCCDVTYPTPLTSSLHSKPPTAALTMNSSFDPQRQCKFFAAPTEVRYAIYTYLIPDRMHLSLREKGFRLSSCVQREKDGHPSCGYMRSNDADITPGCELRDPFYARRIGSKWGEHWRCEEAAIEMDGGSNTNCDNTLMFLHSVCKRMSVNDTLCQGSCPADHHCRFTDVAEAIADTVAIEINDCDTLGSLVSNSGPEALISGQSCTSILFGCVLPNLKELGISLKPPLAAYEEFEYADDSVSSKSPFTSAWKALPPAIEHMSRLRKLRIWLDHEEPCSWSMVNERAALSPLASISNNPNLSVSINLPNCIPMGNNKSTFYKRRCTATTTHPPALSTEVPQRTASERQLLCGGGVRFPGSGHLH
jgi:hypothetical protein